MVSSTTYPVSFGTSARPRPSPVPIPARTPPSRPRSLRCWTSRPSDVRRVPGEQVRIWVDDDRGIVDGGRGLTEPGRDEPDLAGVFADVARREDPRLVRRHARIDDDVPLVELQVPLCNRSEVGGKAERGDHRVRG